MGNAGQRGDDGSRGKLHELQRGRHGLPGESIVSRGVPGGLLSVIEDTARTRYAQHR